SSEAAAIAAVPPAVVRRNERRSMPGRDSGRFIGARKLDAAHRIVKRAPAQTAVVAGLCGLRRQVDTAAGRLTPQGGAIFRRVRGRYIERFRSPRVTDAGSQ